MRPATLSALAATLIAASSAQAQIPLYDHLQCFPVKAANAPFPRHFTADLIPEHLPPLAAAAGCKINPKPALLCTDVAKENAQPAGALLPVHGERTRDYLCYKIKCPPSAGGLAGATVTDQFGEHQITTRPSKYVCAPAIHGPAPRPTAAPCNDLGGGQCSDTCPGSDRCHFVPVGFELVGSPVIPVDIVGADDCRCVPEAVSCEAAPNSVCAVAGPLLCADSAEHCILDGSACGCSP